MTSEPQGGKFAVDGSAPRKRRWPRRIAIAFLLLFVAIVSAYGIWRYRAGAARDAAIAKIREAGEPVWFADLRPEPLNPAEDGTPLLLKAFAVMQPLPVELEEEMRELREPPEDDEEMGDAAFEFDADAGEADEFDRDETAEDALPPIKPLPRTFAMREAQLVEKLRPHVDANRAVFELLDELREKPRFQFATNYDDPMPILRTSSEPKSYLEAISLLEARWRCEVHDGDIAAAGTTIVRMLQCTHGMAVADSSVLTLLFSSVGVSTSVESLSEAIQRGRIDESSGNRISMLLGELEGLTRVRPAFINHRADTMTVIENMLEHGNEGEPIVRSQILRDILRPVVWANQVNYLESMAPQVEYADRYDDEAAEALAKVEALEADSAKNLLFNLFTFGSLLFPGEVFNERVRHTRDQINSARVGLRVDAFRTKNGRLPKTLDEVTDEVLPEILRDVAGSEPLAYVVAKDAFAICPAAYVEIERKRLAERVERRDAEGKPRTAEPDEPINPFFGAVEEEDTAWDEETRTGAFRVVYPRTGDAAEAGDGEG